MRLDSELDAVFNHGKPTSARANTAEEPASAARSRKLIS